MRHRLRITHITQTAARVERADQLQQPARRLRLLRSRGTNFPGKNLQCGIVQNLRLLIITTVLRRINHVCSPRLIEFLAMNLAVATDILNHSMTLEAPKYLPAGEGAGPHDLGTSMIHVCGLGWLVWAPR